MRIQRSKLIRRVSTPIAALLGTYILLVLFPQPLFAHTVEYQNFRIHSHDLIPANIYPLLDEVTQKLVRSELKSPARVHKIFLCSSKREFAFFAPHRRSATSLNYQLGHNIFVAPTDIKENRVGYRGHYGSTLTWIVTHEIVHSLEQDAIGFWPALALPFWKPEGYAEFISEESGINLRDGIRLLRRDSSPHLILSKQIAIPRRYFEARLLVEYYLLTRKSSFVGLVYDPIDINELRQEMNQWADEFTTPADNKRL
jgi:hypothetical protein